MEIQLLELGRAQPERDDVRLLRRLDLTPRSRRAGLASELLLAITHKSEALTVHQWHTLVASSISTAPTDHGAPIPSAASNTLAVIPVPVSAFNQPKSYPLELSDSQFYGRDALAGVERDVYDVTPLVGAPSGIHQDSGGGIDQGLATNASKWSPRAATVARSSNSRGRAAVICLRTFSRSAG